MRAEWIGQGQYKYDPSKTGVVMLHGIWAQCPNVQFRMGKASLEESVLQVGQGPKSFYLGLQPAEIAPVVEDGVYQGVWGWYGEYIVRPELANVLGEAEEDKVVAPKDDASSTAATGGASSPSDHEEEEAAEVVAEVSADESSSSSSSSMMEPGEDDGKLKEAMKEKLAAKLAGTESDGSSSSGEEQVPPAASSSSDEEMSPPPKADSSSSDEEVKEVPPKKSKTKLLKTNLKKAVVTSKKKAGSVEDGWAAEIVKFIKANGKCAKISNVGQKCKRPDKLPSNVKVAAFLKSRPEFIIKHDSVFLK